MSCDKLVFDLSEEVEGSPNVFVRKDWINILDNQNQNYQNNQSIIDTSQLANSNKYMAYREAYLAMPLLLSLKTPVTVSGTADILDYGLGLKNWFGQIIHSLTLDYNGTTIVQQTPFCNMWNSFKLMTTLSYNDILTQGPTIGFYPDTSDSWGYKNNIGVVNNTDGTICTVASSLANNLYNRPYSMTPSVGGVAGTITINGTIAYTGGNMGLTQRTKWIAFNKSPYSPVLGANAVLTSDATYGQIGVSPDNLAQIWKSNICKKQQATTTANGLLQVAVMATIYLKHIHSFFNMVPLLKGVFMKLTLNLNNGSCAITRGTDAIPYHTAYTSNVYVGGVQPLMIPDVYSGSQFIGDVDFADNSVFYYDITVGSKTYNPRIADSVPAPIEGNVSKSVYLYVPSYTFNPTFEEAYLSNSVKQVKYTDIYQFQVLNISTNTQFNNLVTNGIANIKSVLIIPFFSNVTSAINVDGTTAVTIGSTYTEWQSPFDPAGCGCTAPMVPLGNFNIQISGQNAIYNTQRYTFEEWNNQLYGQNAVNGGLTDGLTSGLIDFHDFQHSYGFYYVNVERMMPVEQSVPKSVQVMGTNYSTMPINLWIFIEYGVQVSIDVETGSRV